jgi:two-component system NtrC family sensor kinase
MQILRYFFLTAFILLLKNAIADPVYVFTPNTKLESAGKFIEYCIDSSNNIFFLENLDKADFKSLDGAVSVFPVSKYDIWLRFSVHNKSQEPNILLYVGYSNISLLELYKDSVHHLIKYSVTGNSLPVTYRLFNTPNYYFKLDVQPDSTQTFYLRVSSSHPLLLPMYVGSVTAIANKANSESIILSLYFGIIFAIFFYNLFLYISTFDKSYLYYIIFVFFLGVAQLILTGYPFLYLWKAIPAINQYAVPVSTCFAGIAASLFTVYFLKTKYYTPVIHKIFIFITIIYALAIIFSAAGANIISYKLIDYVTLIAAVISLFTSFKIARKGYRPAYFYFISWIAFALGLVIFGFRNLNIVSDNIITSNILYLGSAAETILLSFALADRINTLSKEKEESQLYALKVARENEVLIKEQNIVLEQKVEERTEELQKANKKLSKTLGDLQDAQIQLVEAEKMASLGQLTAGIAHEINNPINFVKSNIKPLRLDINDIFEIVEDYNQLHNLKNGDIAKHLDEVYEKGQSLDVEFIKTEIQQLLKGIEEGAERTAEIVRGLKTFSRLDEAELKTANVHDGLESTLVLLRNSIPKYIKIEKNFGANGEIDCLPGKLNQVFMNILNNGIQAIAEKSEINEEEFITIATKDTKDDHIQISIKDTGKGMTEQVKHRVFEPFFTTKAVGEGTGLGMAIVFKIIEEHHGKIDIISEPGKGAEFIITLPRLHSIS